MSRACSIANAPEGDGSVELHIRRVEGGRFITWAFSGMKVGDRVKGCWFCLNRPMDATGAAIDLLLSPPRSTNAGQALFTRDLAGLSNPQPRVITTGKVQCHLAAISERKEVRRALFLR